MFRLPRDVWNVVYRYVLRWNIKLLNAQYHECIEVLSPESYIMISGAQRYMNDRTLKKFQGVCTGRWVAYRRNVDASCIRHYVFYNDTRKFVCVNSDVAKLPVNY